MFLKSQWLLFLAQWVSFVDQSNNGWVCYEQLQRKLVGFKRGLRFVKSTVGLPVFMCPSPKLKLFLFEYLCGKATVTSVNITLFWENDCLCHWAAVAFSPFWKLRVWMWCRTCIVQYVRDAQCFTPLSGFWNKKCVTIQCWKLNVTFFTHIQKCHLTILFQLFSSIESLHEKLSNFEAILVRLQAWSQLYISWFVESPADECNMFTILSTV